MYYRWYVHCLCGGGEEEGCGEEEDGGFATHTHIKVTANRSQPNPQTGRSLFKETVRQPVEISRLFLKSTDTNRGSWHPYMIAGLHHDITTLLHHCINSSLYQWYHYITTSIYHYITTSLHITASLHHYINTSLHHSSLHHYIIVSLHLNITIYHCVTASQHYFITYMTTSLYRFFYICITAHRLYLTTIFRES